MNQSRGAGRRLTLIVWVAAGMLAAALVVRHVSARLDGGALDRGTRLAVEASPFVPYTLVLREVMSAPEGEREGMMLTVALRADGSRVERVDYQLRTRAEVVRLLFLTGEEFIQTDEVRGVLSRTRMTRRDREPKQDCLASADGRVLDRTERVVGDTTVQGYRTIVVAGARAKSWFAPALSCALLGQRLEFESGWNERRIDSIKPGDPSEGLFALEGLREVPLRTR